MSARVPLTLTILKSHYKAVNNLRVYLYQIITNASQINLDQDGDSSTYTELLDGAYVALSADVQKKLVANDAFFGMSEAIKRVQYHILNTQTTNIITAGYQLPRRVSTAVGGILPVINYQVNSIVTALQSPEWETLLTRIGYDVMLHLLRDTSVFIALPNNCFCQMTGRPMVNVKALDTKIPFAAQAALVTKGGLKRKASELDPNERPTKRTKLQSATSFASNGSIGSTKGRKPPPRPPSDIYLSRFRLFYSRPTSVPSTGALMVGLPAKHILNQLNHSYVRVPKVHPDDWADPDPKMLMNNARTLAKYVFPRQHGLSNPFQLSKDSFDTSYNYAEEIKRKGYIKTPKRVNPALDLLEKLIWRHGKCAYKPLRDKLCPARIDHQAKLDEKQKIIRKTQFLEMMSEHSLSSGFPSQNPNVMNTSVDSEGLTIDAIGLTQAAEFVDSKPRCTDFAVSHFEVFRYVVVVTEEVIPRAFWGSKKNFQVVTKYIKEFISGRRYEDLSLHRVLQNFGTSDCDWVCSDNPAAQKQTRVSVSDSLKRRELIEEFMYWYFNSFLLPLLKTAFYATESSMYRNRILYFRHDDWKALCEPLIDRLTQFTFRKMDSDHAEALLSQRRIGFSFVRLLPKEAGVRPIVNLRRKQRDSNSREESINKILKTTFEILSYEKDNNPQLMGESVFGPDETYRKLKAFKTRLSGGNPLKKLPKLYFVKVDVQSCFDTIDQSKLLEIIQEIISEDEYALRRYGTITSAGGKIARKFIRRAVPIDDEIDFFPYAVELAAALRNTIFVDQVSSLTETKQDVLALLEEHITENIVKIGKTYYRQVVGIPQGSILSTLLCNFSYGDLERKKFKFSEDPNSVLLRLVDDYLLITTSLPTARKFLQVMNDGHPEYGCTISQEKTKTNFDFGHQVSNIVDPHQKDFPWCGYLIDMKDLSIAADYSRFHGNYVQDSLTILIGRKPGEAFKTKMIKLSVFKYHHIFCDTELSTVRGVYFNLYTNFVLSAMRMHTYLKVWGIDLTNSAKLVSETVDKLIRCAYRVIQNKFPNASAKGVSARCDIKENYVIWLGAHAFHSILTKFPEGYKQILAKLEVEMSRAQHKGLSREFSTLVQEGLRTLSHLRI